MTRLVWLFLLLGGCVLPFVHSHREKPQPPAAVQRFSAKAQALAHTPGAPGLSEVTYSMSAAIEALPQPKGGDGEQLAIAVSKQAGAMIERPTETETLARDSLDQALEAVRQAKPSGKKNKDQAVEVARQAIEKVEPGQPATINTAYREVARAMVVVTGGVGAVKGSELSQLVARFSVEEPDDARRTGAQVIAAMGELLPRLPHPPKHAEHLAKELRERAERLATAAPLDYAAQLQDALSLVVGSFDRAAVPPAEQRRLDEAKLAVAAIRGDRPLALQQAAAQEALRLVTEAITASANPDH